MAGVKNGSEISPENPSKSKERNLEISDMAPERHCMPMCVHDGKEAEKEMIQCCLCTKWYHNECVALDPNFQAFWPCPFCRSLAAEIRHIKSSQNDMREALNIVRRTTTKLYKSLESANKQLNLKNKECDDLSDENAKLRTKIDELISENARLLWQGFANRNSLLIGDSVIREIDPSKLHNTEVLCLPGGRIENAREALQSKIGSFSNVTLCVGSNDCTDDVEDLESLIPKYKELISIAQKKVPSPKQVVVSSILPRCDEPQVQDFIDDFNEDLEQLARESGAAFVNNSDNFKLMNGSPNEALFLNDGVHPTYKATNNLARNLGLITHPKHQFDVCKRVKRKHRSQFVQDGSTDRRPVNPTNRNQKQRPVDRPQPSARSYDRNTHRHQRSFTRATPHSQHGHDFENPHCWNCGEQNHVARRCRHAQPLSCYQCGKSGHKAKFCFEDYTR